MITEESLLELSIYNQHLQELNRVERYFREHHGLNTANYEKRLDELLAQQQTELAIIKEVCKAEHIHPASLIAETYRKIQENPKLPLKTALAQTYLHLGGKVL